ncbi:MAG TPA: carboxylesterase [Xanthomonadaceae bacterium]|nr:carboxylesterase [Xanthomonadaceae bacterium]
MLETLEIVTAAEPRHAVIWLHGLGADGHDFESIVPELIEPDWPPLRFVFPHAPVRPITINGGLRMRAWYDILGLEIAQRQDDAGVRESVGYVRALIAREAERGIAPERVFLAGFSQGGAIALAAGLSHPEPLAGIVALSTYLPLAEQLEAEASAANRDTPIFMAHGSLDPVVGHPLGQMSRDFLVRHGYTVQWHSYAMPHSVSAAEIADLSRWLGERLRQPRGR